MSCTEYGGSSRGFFCSNYISDEKLVFLDAQYANIGQYESTLVLERATAFLGFYPANAKAPADKCFVELASQNVKKAQTARYIFRSRFAGSLVRTLSQLAWKIFLNQEEREK